MKRAVVGDILWISSLFLISALLVIPQTHQFFIQWTRDHPYGMGFFKFAILATMGELLALRLANRAWKKMGRYVKLGEKGIPILAPMFYREDPDDEDSQKVLRGFRVVHVFDLAQTDGQPLPEAPNWKSPEKNLELNQRLVKYAESQGIKVSFKNLPGEIQGASLGGEIYIDLAAGTKTILHTLI